MILAAKIIVGILIFIYVELAIATGYFMHLITNTETVTSAPDKEKQKKRQDMTFSIMAGILFPITFAIMAAYIAAGKRGKK